MWVAGRTDLKVKFKSPKICMKMFKIMGRGMEGKYLENTKISAYNPATVC